jgi:hypothetical protein
VAGRDDKEEDDDEEEEVGKEDEEEEVGKEDDEEEVGKEEEEEEEDDDDDDDDGKEEMSGLFERDTLLVPYPVDCHVHLYKCPTNFDTATCDSMYPNKHTHADCK